MTPCECPLAGYCTRHKVTKPNGWHKLCQTRESYFRAWEEGRGPGQKPNTDKEIRRKRIEYKIQQRQRLISWLTFYGMYFYPSDRGVGDTVHRLNMKSCKHPELHKLLTDLIALCSTCKHRDAITELNNKYSYNKR